MRACTGGEQIQPVTKTTGGQNLTAARGRRESRWGTGLGGGGRGKGWQWVSGWNRSGARAESIRWTDELRRKPKESLMPYN